MSIRSFMAVAVACVALLAVLATSPSPAWAQDEEKVFGWSQSAELSLVATAGNAESDTFGMKASFLNTMESSTLELAAAALRAESTTSGRIAVGPPPFVIQDTSVTTLTAENYSVRGRYDRLLSERFFWYTGLTWEKNELAGFRERITGVVGVGHLWWEREDSHFRTDYGITSTSQDDLIDNPALGDSFLGARLSYDYGRQLTETAEFASALIVDQNLDESEDRRADFTNSLSISISDHLALKVSLQALWDNLPALGLAPVLDPTGTPTGLTVPFELDDLDTIFTTALVIDF